MGRSPQKRDAHKGWGFRGAKVVAEGHRNGGSVGETHRQQRTHKYKEAH